MPIKRTEEEVRHAMKRFNDSRDGLRQMRLFAHAMIADQSVETLKWMLGEESTFGATLDKIDAEIKSALSVNN